ncbi:hypothetical protein D9M72_562210 [compost metagenome]
MVLEVDTYWAAVGGEDPADLLRRLGDRVAAIHVKDGPVSKDTKAQLPAGQGKIDLASVLGAVPALEVAVVEFDDYTGDVFDGIAASLKYLKTNAPISPPQLMTELSLSTIAQHPQAKILKSLELDR